VTHLCVPKCKTFYVKRLNTTEIDNKVIIKGDVATFCSKLFISLALSSFSNDGNAIICVGSVRVGGTRSVKRSSRRCSAASVLCGPTVAVLDATTTPTAP
jgi:hypothetical protein